MKFLETLIELFYWTWIFLCPTAILGFVGFLCYYNDKTIIGIVAFVALLLTGIGLGIYFAERIRRSVGCAAFITRSASTKKGSHD
jgi:hypothetical protein